MSNSNSQVNSNSSVFDLGNGRYSPQYPGTADPLGRVSGVGYTNRTLSTVVEDEMKETLKVEILLRKLRYSSGAVNGFFLLFGVVILLFSSWFICEAKEYLPNVESATLKIAGFIVTVGTVVLAVGSLGLYGAMKPSVIAMYGYFIVILPMMVAECAVVTLCWFDTEFMEVTITSALSVLFANYGDTDNSLGLAATYVIDDIQVNRRCCGNTSSTDWADEAVTTYWNSMKRKRASWPDSCCNSTVITDISEDDYTTPNISAFDSCAVNKKEYVTETEYFNSGGCNETVTTLLWTYIDLVAGVFLFLLLAHLVVIIANSAFVLQWRRSERIAREARREVAKKAREALYDTGRPKARSWKERFRPRHKLHL